MRPLVERIRRARGSPNWPYLERTLHAMIDAARSNPSHPVHPQLRLVRGALYSDPLPEEEWCEESEI